AAGEPLPLPLHGLVLELEGQPAGNGRYELGLHVRGEAGKNLRSTRATVDAGWLPGLIALTTSTQPPPAVDLAAPRPPQLPPVSQVCKGEGRFAFSKLELEGGKVTRHPERSFGPILWTTHTLDNDGTLCLLAQAAPFARSEVIEGRLMLPDRDPQFAKL